MQKATLRDLESRHFYLYNVYDLMFRMVVDTFFWLKNSCPRLPHFVDSRFGLYHVAVVLSFLRSPALQKFESFIFLAD